MDTHEGFHHFWRRIFLSVGLALLAAGVAYALGRGGDVILGAIMAVIGGLCTGVGIPMKS